MLLVHQSSVKWRKEPIDLYRTMCQLCILTWNEEWPRAPLPVSFAVFVEIGGRAVEWSGTI